MEQTVFVLSERQLLVLRAVVDRIIPVDEFASGWEAGVGDYILRQFAGDLAHLVGGYQSGLDSLDLEAGGFVELSDSMKDDVLRRVGAGHVVVPWTISPAGFFQLLVANSSEGFYADPGNVGNRDQISWKMIGFEVTG